MYAVVNHTTACPFVMENNFCICPFLCVLTPIQTFIINFIDQNHSACPSKGTCLHAACSGTYVPCNRPSGFSSDPSGIDSSTGISRIHFGVVPTSVHTDKCFQLSDF